MGRTAWDGGMAPGIQNGKNEGCSRRWRSGAKEKVCSRRWRSGAEEKVRGCWLGEKSWDVGKSSVEALSGAQKEKVERNTKESQGQGLLRGLGAGVEGGLCGPDSPVVATTDIGPTRCLP